MTEVAAPSDEKATEKTEIPPEDAQTNADSSKTFMTEVSRLKDSENSVCFILMFFSLCKAFW